MLSRYLSAIVIGLLVSAWLVAAAFSTFYVINSRDLARGVATGTATYQRLFRDADQQRLAELQFPRGRLFRTVQTSWSSTLPRRAYPNGLVATPSQASAISRPGGGTTARPRVGPRRP
jgi:hypothetical protein